MKPVSQPIYKNPETMKKYDDFFVDMKDAVDCLTDRSLGRMHALLVKEHPDFPAGSSAEMTDEMRYAMRSAMLAALIIFLMSYRAVGMTFYFKGISYKDHDLGDRIGDLTVIGDLPPSNILRFEDPGSRDIPGSEIVDSDEKMGRAMRKMIRTFQAERNYGNIFGRITLALLSLFETGSTVNIPKKLLVTIGGTPLPGCPSL